MLPPFSWRSPKNRTPLRSYILMSSFSGAVTAACYCIAGLLACCRVRVWSVVTITPVNVTWFMCRNMARDRKGRRREASRPWRVSRLLAHAGSRLAHAMRSSVASVRRYEKDRCSIERLLPLPPPLFSFYILLLYELATRVPSLPNCCAVVDSCSLAPLSAL